jgi:hypothetical protein
LSTPKRSLGFALDAFVDAGGPKPCFRGNQGCLGRAFGLDDRSSAINVNVGDTLHEARFVVVQARRLHVAHHNSSAAGHWRICRTVRNRHFI